MDYIQNLNNNSNSILFYFRSDFNGFVVCELLIVIKDNIYVISIVWILEQFVIVIFVVDLYYCLWIIVCVFYFGNNFFEFIFYNFFFWNMGYLSLIFFFDDVIFWNGGQFLFYGLVYCLQKIFVFDEDIVFVEVQKINCQQIEQDFVFGSFGKIFFVLDVYWMMFIIWLVLLNIIFGFMEVKLWLILF